MQSAWNQMLQSSHATPRCRQVTALLQMPQGYFVVGPGLVSMSLDRSISTEVRNGSIQDVKFFRQHWASVTLASLDAWVSHGTSGACCSFLFLVTCCGWCVSGCGRATL